MKTSILTVNSQDKCRVLVTTGFMDRLRGMLFRRPLPPAMVIRPCDSVHGAFMGSALDVAFLDGEGRVLRTALLRPWGMLWPVRGARAVLEAPAGSFAGWGLDAGSRVTYA